MTEDQFLDRLGVEEGVVYAEKPQTDQPTGPYGITLAALTEDRGRPCAVADLKALSAVDAREVARRKIRRDLVKYGFDRLAYEPLRMQMLDFSYNSGEERAIRWLQRATGIALRDTVDAIDDLLVARLTAIPSVVINNALVAARLRMIDDATDTGTVAKKFEEGLENRALSFGIFG